ncbi:MAG: F0F1 ATP synthase subunit epsilon [Gammaproteobacteria bacterium]|nr:F0F1 ATP synthase subunit epsilon [Gammaproteobacteria bacterium]
MSVIHVDVVSATEEIYSGDAKCVFAPASMGEIGVYPMHVALISTLKPGEVRIETENGVESIYVSGGIVEVQPHTVTIFSDTAIRAHDLDESKAIEAKQRAEEAMANAQSDQEVSSTQAALAESMMQLQLISKMRGRKG